jgi:hypothetical protein
MLNQERIALMLEKAEVIVDRGSNADIDAGYRGRPANAPLIPYWPTLASLPC